MKKLLLAILGLSSFLASAQQDAEVTVPSGDGTLRSAYIRGYPDQFFIWPVLKQRRLDFELKKTDDKRELSYNSNKPFSVGLGMYIFELAVEIAFAVPFNEQNKRIYGESEARDLQLNVLGRRWGVDLYHQRYRGFYLEDSGIDIPANDPYPQRPDIRTRNVGATVSHIFNRNKFSFRSPYNFSERQLKSGGSFVAFASLRNFKVTGDSAFVDDEYADIFADVAGIRKLSVTLMGVAPGYTYNLIYRGFFLNGTLAIGPGYNWITFERDNGLMAHRNDISAMIVARVALGYNGDKIFGGMSFSNQGGTTRFDDVEMTNSNSTFKILIGYRFNEWGILKKRVWDLPDALMR